MRSKSATFFRMIVLFVIAVSLVGGEPALAAKKKKVKRAPGDIAYIRDEDAMQFPPAVFQHWRHVAQFRCYACHSDLFEMQQSQGLGEEMHKGDMCGGCHRGEPAFDISLSTCHRCHIASAEKSKGKDKKKKKKKQRKDKGTDTTKEEAG